MVSMHSIFLAALALAIRGAAAIPAPEKTAAPVPIEARQGGFTIQYWANENAELDWVSGPEGEYEVTWDQPDGGNFVVGKGYRPATEMLFNYSGTFEVDGRAYLGLYGWTTDPLVEYYVIESFGIHNPSDNTNSTCHGTFESDGGTYEVWDKWRVNAPSIIGEATFQQYWSVRTRRHVGGTINTGNHFAAWERAGLPLGSQHAMVIAIEGQEGSGLATLTAAVPPTTSVAESSTPTIRTQRTGQSNTCTADLNS